MATRHHCINHPGTNSAAHCAQCHKPICKNCIAASSGGGHFCSLICEAENIKFRRDFKGGVKPPSNIVGNLISLAMLVGAVIGGLYVGKLAGIGFCKEILKIIGL
jgi:hypothetical protein